MQINTRNALLLILVLVSIFTLLPYIGIINFHTKGEPREAIVAVSMLNYVGEKDIGNSRIASKILLTIVYAVGVGGLASPLGGAMNLVVIDYIQKLTGTVYMYAEWVVKVLPIMILLIGSNILFMCRESCCV